MDWFARRKDTAALAAVLHALGDRPLGFAQDVFGDTALDAAAEDVAVAELLLSAATRWPPLSPTGPGIRNC